MPIVNEALGCILASWKKKKEGGDRGKKGEEREKGREDRRKENLKRETKGEREGNSSEK